MSSTLDTLPQPPPASAPPAGWLEARLYPPGTTRFNWFSLFNAISWQITLGSPVVLYAKSQGASETYLGIITALTPLLVIFQLPAAHYLPRYGYRQFLLAGWGTRTLFIFALALVPLLWPVPAWGRLGLVFLCLLGFNFVRGIASGAWYPWISEVIPEHLRGRFLSRDQVFTQLGSLAALSIAAFGLQGQARPWQFTLVLLISALGGTASLLFLRRIPDATAPERMKTSGHRVPWVAMLTYPPFFRLMGFNLLYYFVMGGLTVFTVAFLKTEAGYQESHILWLATLSIFGGLLSVPFLGQFLDRLGSRRVLMGTMLIFMVILAGWFALAAHLSGRALLMVALLNLLYGVGSSNFTVANGRLMMATMPLMGRNHFFALFTVITNVGLGLTPVLWGLLLDGLGQFQASSGLIAWNRYSIYFALAFAVAVLALACAALLHDQTDRAD